MHVTTLWNAKGKELKGEQLFPWLWKGDDLDGVVLV